MGNGWLGHLKRIEGGQHHRSKPLLRESETGKIVNAAPHRVARQLEHSLSFCIERPMLLREKVWNIFHEDSGGLDRANNLAERHEKVSSLVFFQIGFSMRGKTLAWRAPDEDEFVEALDLPSSQCVSQQLGAFCERVNVKALGVGSNHSLVRGTAMAIMVDARDDGHVNTIHACLLKSATCATATAKEVDHADPNRLCDWT
jgi:hypothetical protein